MLWTSYRTCSQAQQTPGNPAASDSQVGPKDFMTPDSNATVDQHVSNQKPTDQALNKQLDALKMEVEAFKEGRKRHEEMLRQVALICIDFCSAF